MDALRTHPLRKERGKDGAPGKGEPPLPGSAVGNLDKPEPGPLKPLNFKVPDAFRREFKIYAATKGMTMVDVLLASFEAFKR